MKIQNIICSFAVFIC